MEPRPRVKRDLPVPQRLTALDVYRVVLGFIAVPLGFFLLYRTLQAGGLSVPAVLIGVAFVGFGIYRTWFAWQRYQMYRASQDKGV
jgi:hypothetical protein